MPDQARISRNELVARIAAGESMDSIIESVLPRGHRAVLKSAALVRWFDREHGCRVVPP